MTVFYSAVYDVLAELNCSPTERMIVVVLLGLKQPTRKQAESAPIKVEKTYRSELLDRVGGGLTAFKSNLKKLEEKGIVEVYRCRGSRLASTYLFPQWFSELVINGSIQEPSRSDSDHEEGSTRPPDGTVEPSRSDSDHEDQKHPREANPSRSDSDPHHPPSRSDSDGSRPDSDPPLVKDKIFKKDDARAGIELEIDTTGLTTAQARFAQQRLDRINRIRAGYGIAELDS
jgi:DNA-binding transcriptional ArsR family regulator